MVIFFRKHFVAAILGFAITAIFVAYRFTIDFRAPASRSTSLLIGFFTVLCPPALLSIPIIDVEVGTSGFYVLWVFIAVVNAVLYSAIAGAIARLRREGSFSASNITSAATLPASAVQYSRR
jgi:hypothetical protein